MFTLLPLQLFKMLNFTEFSLQQWANSITLKDFPNQNNYMDLFCLGASGLQSVLRFSVLDETVRHGGTCRKELKDTRRAKGQE